MKPAQEGDIRDILKEFELALNNIYLKSVTANVDAYRFDKSRIYIEAETKIKSTLLSEVQERILERQKVYEKYKMRQKGLVEEILSIIDSMKGIDKKEEK